MFQNNPPPSLSLSLSLSLCVSLPLFSSSLLTSPIQPHPIPPPHCPQTRTALTPQPHYSSPTISSTAPAPCLCRYPLELWKQSTRSGRRRWNGIRIAWVGLFWRRLLWFGWGEVGAVVMRAGGEMIDFGYKIREAVRRAAGVSVGGGFEGRRGRG